MGNANTSTRVQLNRSTKQAEWLQLYASGMTYQQIADRYETSKSTICNAVKRGLTDAQSRRAEMQDHIFELHLERIELLIRAHWPVALNTKANPEAADRAARTVMHLLDREARMFGLDQPQQVQVTIRTRDEIDEEIARLVKRMKEHAPAGVATPILDSIVEEVDALPAGEDT